MTRKLSHKVAPYDNAEKPIHIHYKMYYFIYLFKLLFNLLLKQHLITYFSAYVILNSSYISSLVICAD